MKKLIVVMGLMGAGAAGAQSVSVSVAPANSLEFGIAAGYYGGGSIGGSFTARNVGNSSFGLRGTFMYTGVDGFNDNAIVASGVNGGPNITAGQLFKSTLPNESGRNITIGADVLYHLGFDQGTGLGANVYAGVRYNLFNTTLSGSEGSVTWSSNQLGLGAGVVASYPVAANVYLTGDLGIDYYFPAAIVQSNSNGQSQTIGTGDPAYNDTRAFVNTPSTVFKAKVGVAVRF